ncbi:hypothetical protein JDV02_006003 [Purpureocillium takamizusanense]|uniref:Uncharacterized protein n=1 Tax=Purpureocillium takamizusanense TaxID=2060973 RepID=A0A9Q8QII4_9HYPO|nr:uncharacterized protein JDV02_006003 [Purpureocillium takamizusanense]UNI19857.1 hypothetical protein JDV02_006003 [Purpureocillium takamizusanense]
MPPAIIADSDDDSDGAQDHVLAPEEPAEHGLLLATRSSDRGSHTTNSTDPVLFQNIYNEHKAAGDQQALTAGAGEGLEVGDAAGRTATPSRMDAQNDLWNIPSSPEANVAKRIKPLSAKRTTSVKVTRGLRRNLEMLGYESVSDDNYDEPIHERRKRRKVGASRDFQRSSNDVSLVELPPDGGLPSAASQSVSTEFAADQGVNLPMDRTSPPLLIAPRQLSASQKREYQSVEAPFSSPAGRIMEVRNPAVGSSGTATNVNTQRSHMLSSFDVGLTVRTPEHEMIRVTRRTSPTPRQRRNSSPDVITSMAPPTQTPKPKATRAKQGGTSTGEATNPSHSVGKGDEVWAASKAEESEGSEYTAPESQVKPKRPRGRPKKGREDKPDATSTSATQEAAAKPKRKRGRPKKRETLAKDDHAMSVTDDASAVQAAADRKLSHVTKTDLASEGDVDNEPRVPTSTTDPQRGSSTKEGTRDGPKQTTTDLVEVPVPEKTGKEPSELGKKELPVNDTVPNNRSTSKLDSTGKPVYRVGLSKRLRIAPLLKSLRK